MSELTLDQRRMINKLAFDGWHIDYRNYYQNDNSLEPWPEDRFHICRFSVELWSDLDISDPDNNQFARGDYSLEHMIEIIGQGSKFKPFQAFDNHGNLLWQEDNAER